MQGKISDFSIPDIFQLIASQRKSGSLLIREEGKETVFLFSEGLIVDVHPDKRDYAGMLGTMLVDGGLITDEQLKRVLAGREKSGKKLGELLVENRFISGDTLARYLSLQIKESVFDILKLKEGDYKFEGFAVHPPAWMTTPIRADVLMMEGMQFLDEYPIYREKFPSGDFRVTRKRGEKVEESALAEDERRIWKAIDFSPEPRRIFRKTCMTWFEGIKGLWALADRGIVDIRTTEVRREEAPSGIRAEISRNRAIGYARAAAWAVAALVAATWVYTILLSPSATKMFAAWVRFF